MSNHKADMVKVFERTGGKFVTKILIIIDRNDPIDQAGRPNYECFGFICDDNPDLRDNEYLIEVPSGNRFKASIGLLFDTGRINQYSIKFDDTDWIDPEWFQLTN